MRPNPAALALGYAPTDRLVVFHMDDVGMCHAANAAYAELLECGTITSAALMVPCPAAREGAQIALNHPQADLGVHLTITSEWDTYRWGPVSTTDPASSLRDAEGCFPRTNAEIQARGRADAVRAELRAQLIQALAWGVDATHVDSHMGALAHPKFLPAAIGEALGRGLPPMFPRRTVAEWRADGSSLPEAAFASGLARALEGWGLPLVDRLYSLPLAPGDHLELTRRVLDELPPGITHFILHPSADTPELRSICGDWAGRVANYDAFRDPRMPGVIAASGVVPIGYRPLRGLLRSRRQA